MNKLAGKVAIVTGASKGIGAAIAKGLAEAGAAVRSPAAAEDSRAAGGASRARPFLSTRPSRGTRTTSTRSARRSSATGSIRARRVTAASKASS